VSDLAATPPDDDDFFDASSPMTLSDWVEVIESDLAQAAEDLTFAHQASHAAPTPRFSIRIIINSRRPLLTVDASGAIRACPIC
jgi:hypothetical protein